MRLSRAVLAPLALVPALAAACSDPVPPTPRAAWSVSFVRPGASCNIAGHNAMIGEVTANTKPTLVSDGTDSAEVSCTVQGSSGFRVDATASQAGKLLQIGIPSITSSANSSAPVKGSVAFASPNTQNTFTSNGGCDFYFAENTGEGVGSGKIWVAFKCDVISQGSYDCEIAQGYAIFENCATSESE